MGNTQGIPEAHVRIYNNTMAIQDPIVRVQMIRTIIRSPEHIESMKQAGIYGKLLHFIQQVESGSGSGSAPAPGLPLQEKLAAPKKTSSVLTTVGQGGQGIQTSQKGNERAMNYFSACLRILQIEEEVAVTVDGLKAAYKKAVLRAHPDKGGSEKEFEAVTRAYAYLGEILERIHGGRAAEGKVEAPTALANNRATHEEKWKMVEPVRLNPAKLDVQTFNDMFEKTKIPDPDETGYGDWLKGGDSASAGPKFSGKFNRDVFNKTFEDEQKGRGSGPKQSGAMVAQEMSMASRMGFGVELGRTGRDDYTVSPNENGLKFTDLKKAYTDYSTFSQDIAGVRVENRTVQQYQAERKAAPVVFTDTEREQLQASERQMAQAEERRKLRVAQEAVEEGSYFERMKRLVIRN
jgi:curved DNA-binding protein CbpA